MQVTTTLFSSRQRQAGGGKPPRVAELADLTRYPLTAPDPLRVPYPGEEIIVNGVQINLRRTPSSNPDAEAALYVHGLGGASTNFTDVADLLSPWFDGHAIDLPGFGRSGPPRNGNYSIASHTRLVISYLEQSGRGPVHLVGNSMGGAISIAVASSRPDLVRTLTLISPAVPDLKPKSAGDPLLPLLLIPGIGTRALARLDRGSAEARAKAIIKLCFAHPERVPANRMAESIAEVEVRRGMPWAHDAMLRSLRGLVRTFLTPGQASPWRALERITAPSLVIWGELDKLVDVSNAPRTARTIPDATLLVLPDVGHTAQLEDPSVTARAILALRERANDGFKRTGVGT
jgi:pimeloyl-ACP methyl ester carboxylesterase